MTKRAAFRRAIVVDALSIEIVLRFRVCRHQLADRRARAAAAVWRGIDVEERHVMLREGFRLQRPPGLREEEDRDWFVPLEAEPGRARKQ